MAAERGVRPWLAGHPMTRIDMGGGGSRMQDRSGVNAIPEQRDSPEQRDFEGGSASAAARRLWEALCRARNEQQPLSQAHLEDAVLGFYLPRARPLADRIATEDTDPDARGRAAELGLATAVLGWKTEDPERFERFLRASTASELRNTEQRRPVGAFAGGARGYSAGSGQSTPEQ
jgi:hypothetical protein